MFSSQDQFALAQTNGSRAFPSPDRLHAELLPVEVQALLNGGYVDEYRPYSPQQRDLVMSGINGYEFTGFDMSQCNVRLLFVVVPDVRLVGVADVAGRHGIEIDLPFDVVSGPR